MLTYSRRGSRFSSRQEAAWASYAERWVIPDEVADAPDFTWDSCFERVEDLVVEIGCGIGESTVALALARPEASIVAFEVWRPGVADTLERLGAAGVDNVRLVGVDAVWSMEHLFAPGSISELLTFFPDPWPKKRHHKRRLVSPDFAAMVASRLQPGAAWRLATDWGDYADQMIEVLDAEPALEGGRVPRWDGRPLTRFERKGLAVERDIVDLCYRRSPVHDMAG